MDKVATGVSDGVVKSKRPIVALTQQCVREWSKSVADTGKKDQAWMKKALGGVERLEHNKLSTGSEKLLLKDSLLEVKRFESDLKERNARNAIIVAQVQAQHEKKQDKATMGAMYVNVKGKVSIDDSNINKQTISKKMPLSLALEKEGSQKNVTTKDDFGAYSDVNNKKEVINLNKEGITNNQLFIKNKELENRSAAKNVWLKKDALEVNKNSNDGKGSGMESKPDSVLNVKAPAGIETTVLSEEASLTINAMNNKGEMVFFGKLTGKLAIYVAQLLIDFSNINSKGIHPMLLTQKEEDGVLTTIFYGTETTNSTHFCYPVINSISIRDDNPQEVHELLRILKEKVESDDFTKLFNVKGMRDFDLLKPLLGQVNADFRKNADVPVLTFDQFKKLVEDSLEIDKQNNKIANLDELKVRIAQDKSIGPSYKESVERRKDCDSESLKHKYIANAMVIIFKDKTERKTAVKLFQYKDRSLNGISKAVEKDFNDKLEVDPDYLEKIKLTSLFTLEVYVS